MKWRKGLECQVQEFGLYQKEAGRERKVWSREITCSNQENRLEGVKQEAEGLEQWTGGQGGSVTRWGGQRRIQ